MEITPVLNKLVNVTKTLKLFNYGNYSCAKQVSHCH